MSTSAPTTVLEAALYWGDSLLAVRRLTDDGQLTLGTADAVDLYIADPALCLPRVAFVQRHGDEVWLQPAEGLKLTVDGAPGPTMPRRLHAHERATFTVGALQIRVAWTSPSRRVAVPFFAGMDFVYTKVLALALVMQAALVAGMMITPTFDDDDDSLVAQAFRWVQLAPVVKQKEPPKPPPKPKVAKVQTPAQEKVFGRERVETAKAKKVAVRRSEREQAEADANKALSILGLEGRSGGAAPGLLSNVHAQVSQLRSATMGQGDGGGLGTRGTGPGGGGGALNIGPVGSPGGGGGGDSPGIELCGGSHCKKRQVAIARAGTPRFEGGLKREEIQRVVNRYLSQIRACYNRELTKDPNLDGKLTVAWVIAPSGLVSTSKVAQDTMSSPAMSGCVKRIVDRMRFPKPRGGGTVNVRYPFLFSN